MADMGLLRRAWLSFAEQVLPVHASAMQRQETRRAFYAGANSLLSVLLTNVSDSDEETPEDAALLPGIQAEIDAFIADMLAGRA